MDESTLIADLRKANRALARELGMVGSRHPTLPCTVTEGHVLVELDLAPDLGLNDIATRLILDKSTTSRAVSALVSRRLVVARADAKDLRRKYFRLSRSGRRLPSRMSA